MYGATCFDALAALLGLGVGQVAAYLAERDGGFLRVCILDPRCRPRHLR